MVWENKKDENRTTDNHALTMLMKLSFLRSARQYGEYTRASYSRRTKWLAVSRRKRRVSPGGRESCRFLVVAFLRMAMVGVSSTARQEAGPSTPPRSGRDDRLVNGELLSRDQYHCVWDADN